MFERSEIFFTGRVSENPFIRPRFLSIQRPERAISDFTWPRLVSSVGSAVMITETLGLPFPFSICRRTGETYVSCPLPLPLFPSELAARGTLIASIATSAVTKPRPPLPHSALERVSPPRLPVPHSALDRVSPRLPVIRTFRSPFRAIRAGRMSFRSPRRRTKARRREEHAERTCAGRPPSSPGRGRERPSSLERGIGAVASPRWRSECPFRPRFCLPAPPPVSPASQAPAGGPPCPASSPGSSI